MGIILEIHIVEILKILTIEIPKSLITLGIHTVEILETLKIPSVEILTSLTIQEILIVATRKALTLLKMTIILETLTLGTHKILTTPKNL